MGGNHVTIIPSKVIIILISDFSTHVTPKREGAENIHFSHNPTPIVRLVIHFLSSKHHYKSPILGSYNS
jgi:hypothetical protein